MSIELDTYTLLNLFLFLGVGQGLIVTCLLFLKKPYHQANLLLGFWILLLALSNVQIIIDTSQLYQILGQRFTLLAPLSLNLFFGPLIWLFCQKLLEPKFRLNKITGIHLIPGLLECLYYLIVFIQPLSFRQQFYGAVHWKYIEPTLEVLATISFITYLLLSIKAIQNFGKALKSTYSESNMETYSWLKQFLLVLLIFSGVWMILTIVDVFVMEYQLSYLYFYPYYLIIAFLSYFIGFSSYFKSKTPLLKIIKPSTEKRELIQANQLNDNILAIQEMMNHQKLYLNNSLKAQELADKLNINVQTLSYILNSGLRMSFHDYVNQFRVKEVKRRLDIGDLNKMNLLGIALESGFNSESSFYRIFKKFTGKTPKAYLKSNS